MYKSFAVLFLAVFPSALYAQVNGITGEVKHHFIITGNDINKIFIVNKSGKTEWEAETKGESYEVTMLPNGNILFPYRWGCALMNRGKEILWDFSSPKEKEQEIHAVQPFCREYDKKGKLLWEFASPFNCYSAVRLKKGNTLIGCGDGHLVLQVNKQKEIVWQLSENEIPGHPLRFVAVVCRLPNGNTIIVNWGSHYKEGEELDRLIEAI